MGAPKPNQSFFSFSSVRIDVERVDVISGQPRSMIAAIDMWKGRAGRSDCCDDSIHA